MKKVAILFIVLLTSSFVFAQNTYVPDDKFEQALIDLGYDTTLDDSVLTENISDVTSLDVMGKDISDLTGIEAFTALIILECDNNQLTSIYTGYNIALKELHCPGNQLTRLDVSNNTALEILNCERNQLTKLDVSNNTALIELYCTTNQLTSLNMRNGITSQLSDFDATGNSGLTCIATLDPDYATANWTSKVDAGVTFSLNCGLADFEWVSSALDTINISKTNLTDTYELKWSESKDVDIKTIDYLISVGVGQLPAEMIYETTGRHPPWAPADTSLTIYYQNIIDIWYPNLAMLSRATLKFSVSATDGIDTVKASGDDRVVFVNRYEYLSTEGEGVPVEFALHENYPNPFNPTTTLRFDLPEVSDITLTIYNMLGQKVRTFNYQNTSAGYHSVKWNATNDYGDPLGAGVYLYQLQTKDFVKTRKMVLLK